MVYKTVSFFENWNGIQNSIILFVYNFKVKNPEKIQLL